jgi:Raf kinase inhibitor-like YbhB/YbcL family protein
MTPEQVLPLTVTSKAFVNGGLMPVRYTHDGENVSPDIAWQGAPAGTKSFLVIMEDRDIPSRSIHLLVWTHWLVYNIPGDVTSLPEALPQAASLDIGAKQGRTSFRKPGYGGPNPPVGTHRYHFQVLALDRLIETEPGKADKKSLMYEAEGHVLAYGELTGEYGKKK